MLKIRDQSGFKRPKTILIVDDDERLAYFTKAALERVGYPKVMVETTCRRGLSAAYEQVPDVLLLDVVLPDGTGGDIAEDIRGKPDFTNTTVVFLTGIVSKRELDHCGGSIGGERFLAKPASLEQLISAIEAEGPSLFNPRPPDEHSFLGRLGFRKPTSLGFGRFALT